MDYPHQQSPGSPSNERSVLELDKLKAEIESLKNSNSLGARSIQSGRHSFDCGNRCSTQHASVFGTTRVQSCSIEGTVKS
jgi:hypothetical protein